MRRNTGDCSMNDGSYEIGVSLEGGSGKASVSSPMCLEVENGEITARVEWSSPNYDLMIVDGERYLPVNTDGNSVFEIPVRTLSEPLRTDAETVAMSEPHLISYELIFDESSLRPAKNPVDLLFGCALIVVGVASAAAILISRFKRKRQKEENA